MTLKPSWLSALLMTFTTSAGFAAFPEGDVGPKLPPAPLTATELAARIDALIVARLVVHGTEPAPLASDAEFMRRVYLDLAGRIPSEAEARAFLADKSADRRARLVESLLVNPLYVRHMANTWQNVLAPFGNNPQIASLPGFRNWLDYQMQANVPYDQMVRHLIAPPTNNAALTNDLRKFQFGPDKTKTPRLDFNPNPNLDKKPVPKLRLKVPFDNEEDEINQKANFAPAPVSVRAGPPPGSYFFEVNEHKPEKLAASVSRKFLGLRIECAQCHNHPRGTWTRKQFWEFATFFTNVPPQQIYLKGDIKESIDDLIEPKITLLKEPAITPPGKIAAAKLQMTIPGTGKVVQARFLDGRMPVWKDNTDARQLLAEWLTSPSNPYFARTGANRLWAHFFGAGIIDPVDDEPTEESPASHADLLAELAAQFVAHQYDVKYLIRAITASKTYQRSSAAADPSQNEPRLFARMAVKGLSPEQLFDNLVVATGFREIPTAYTAAAVIPGMPRSEFLLLFATQDSKTQTQTSILQALTLMNGKLVTDATSLTGNPRFAALLNGPLTNAQKIETLCLTTLSRFPRPEEASRMLRHVEAGGPQNDPRAALADVYWALLNSSEFMFNH